MWCPWHFPRICPFCKVLTQILALEMDDLHLESEVCRLLLLCSTDYYWDILLINVVSKYSLQTIDCHWQLVNKLLIYLWQYICSKNVRKVCWFSFSYCLQVLWVLTFVRMLCSAEPTHSPTNTRLSIAYVCTIFRCNMLPLELCDYVEDINKNNEL